MKRTLSVRLTTKFSFPAFEALQQLAGVTPAEKISDSDDNKHQKKKEIKEKIQTQLSK